MSLDVCLNKQEDFEANTEVVLQLESTKATTDIVLDSTESARPIKTL
jgi:hypothetical protein